MRLILFLSIFSLAIFGCNQPSLQPPSALVEKPLGQDVTESILSETFSIKQMGFHVGVNFFEPQAAKLLASATEFKQSLVAFCSQAGSTKSKSPLTQSWEVLVSDYQQLAGVPFGPFSENSNQFGFLTHSYPYLNTCGVDRNLAGFWLNKDPGVVNYTQKGLATLDYLLFNNKLTHTCQGRATPALLSWEGLSAETKMTSRCEWAKKLTDELIGQVTQFSHRWSGADGASYTQLMLRPTQYRSDKEFLESLVTALYQLEFVKDAKLGNPLGLTRECQDSPSGCAEYVEYRFSDMGLSALEANLKGFAQIFFGSQNPDVPLPGFSMVLNNAGFSKVSERAAKSYLLALQTITNLKAKGSFLFHLESARSTGCVREPLGSASLCDLHGHITDLARIIKGDLLIALSLRAPPQHQGDND